MLQHGHGRSLHFAKFFLVAAFPVLLLIFTLRIQQQGIFDICPATKIVACYYITWNNLQQVYAETECGEKIGRLAAEEQFVRKSACEGSLLTIHPKDRY